MNRRTVLQAVAAATATVAVMAAAPALSSDSVSAMPASWEVTKELDAENAAASHKSALKVEKQRKAAAKRAAAKAKAKAEAERKARQARAARKAARGGTPEQNKALGRQMCAAKGWSASQCNDLVTLWMRESGWSSSAHNSSSGAHGIPQALPGSKMSSHGSDWYSNPRTQIAWGLDYIKGRYGNPSSALAHSNNVGWY